MCVVFCFAKLLLIGTLASLVCGVLLRKTITSRHKVFDFVYGRGGGT